jgi:hypothetical protein
MPHSDLSQEILKQLNQLPVELQRKVLNFAQNLPSSLPKGTPGKELLRFSGIMSAEDIAAMTQAIEEGCEQVDADEC